MPSMQRRSTGEAIHVNQLVQASCLKQLCEYVFEDVLFWWFLQHGFLREAWTVFLTNLTSLYQKNNLVVHARPIVRLARLTLRPGDALVET